MRAWSPLRNMVLLHLCYSHVSSTQHTSTKYQHQYIRLKYKYKYKYQWSKYQLPNRQVEVPVSVLCTNYWHKVT